MSSKFPDVFANLDMDMTDRGLMKNADVTKVSVSSDRSSLTVYMHNKEDIPRSTVYAAETAIKEKIFGGKNIRVNIVITYEPKSAGVSAGAPGPSYGAGNAGSGGPLNKGGGNGGGNGSGSGNSRFIKKPGQEGFKAAENKWTPKQDKKSQNPDVIYGYDFKGEPLSISGLEDGMGDVIISGKIFSPEIIKTRNEKYIIKFNLTDNTDSITCKITNCDENTKNELEDKLKDGKFVMLTGQVTPPSQWDPELTITRVKNIKKMADPTGGREDKHEGKKRTELNLHTKMSDMDGIGDVKDYIKLADKWGWKALAITDNNSVQVLPTASHSLPKGSKLKLIYGVSGSLVDDDKNAVRHPRGQSLDGEFVVFDIETTGFSMKKDRIIEIGAVKVRKGNVVERFSQFIDPERPIPERITELTSITDDHVRGRGNYEKWIPEFLKFIGDGDVPVVGHNAMFDVGFIKNYASLLGLKFDPTVVDTVGLSHMLLKSLFRNKLDNVAKELGISLLNHHRAVDDAEATAGIFMAFVKKLKAMGINDLDALYEQDEMDGETIKKLHPDSFTILARNDLGRTNMYRLISAAHIDYFYGEARMPKSMVNALRDGILIGSGSEDGEIYDAVFRGVGDKELLEMAEFYDYFEVMPPSNLRYLINDDHVPVDSLEDLREAARRIIGIADKLGKPVVATGNTHFCEKGEAVYRKLIKFFELDSKGRKFDEEKYSTPLYLRTTDEMLEDFAFLGAETAERIVIENPDMIADMCERIAPVRPDKCPPVIENSDKELEDACYKTAKEMYGENVPDIVKNRLDKELHSIISNGYSVMYIIAKRLVQDSVEHGYLVGSRGSVGSSLAATFGGISEVNPLPPHYRCPKCHYVDFDSETVQQYKEYSGCDMPDMNCPNCGAPLIKDGFDIPFETFLGFKGDKEPDIDLNFAGDYQPKAHQYTEVLFGKGQTYKAGTVGTVQEKTAFGYVLRYNEKHPEADGAPRHMRKAEVQRLALGCTEVRRTTGQHPGGIVVLPHGEEINTFTPIQHPANVMTNPVTTHLDYHSIDHNLLKLDILGKDDPSMVRMLQDLTGLDPMDIPIGTPEIMSLFAGTEALGITPDDIGGTPLGTMGVPEFGTDFAMQMLLEAKPKYVSDLVRIAGLAHGTDVWLGNAQKLIQEGTCTIQTAICTRDDIMIYLISKGVEPGTAFKIMELTRKGKFPKDGKHEEYCQIMRDHGVPEWYIWSCDTIKYMFPKAHAAAYVVMSWRIAYYKVHYPLAYYAAYYTVKGDGFDYEKMCVSPAKLKQNLADLRNYMDNTRGVTANDKLLLRDMRIVEEMFARGIEFRPIDIFKAKAKEFILTEDGKIMPSLNSIAGLGTIAAESIEADAVNGPYLSLEEFIQRTKVSKTNAELLKSLGLLGSIPDTNQLSLFDLM
ncbi:MAG: PolC-type DNA polymerase III [Eubacteriales bacterium]|nr:PolC-type DNA polymerase III [Eubacteriales bacterium]